MTWAGHYFDPLHGGCLRFVVATADPRVYVIRGVYGDDEPFTGAPWTATLTVSAPDAAIVDFAGKPTKRDRYLACRRQPRAIRWQDGNFWVLLYVHPFQLS